MALEDVYRRNLEHRAHRAGWLRAAVLGINDGLVSTASLMVGVATASASLNNASSIIISTGAAGIAAGALSMAVGEYISVSSQTDIENSDRLLEMDHLAIDPEGELVIVIGQLAKNVSEEDAMDYVWGFTIGNDVSARDIQFRDGQWARAKGFDTFCPLGPWIETEFVPDGQVLETRVDGEIRQKASNELMLFSVPQIIAHVTAAMTLLPGDVIFTGTPAGVGRIEPGQVVEIEVEGIGVLRNPVA